MLFQETAPAEEGNLKWKSRLKRPLRSCQDHNNLPLYHTCLFWIFSVLLEIIGAYMQVSTSGSIRFLMFVSQDMAVNCQESVHVFFNMVLQ
jgi:hypothetical protein